MSTTPRPPQIIPYLFYSDVPAALDFLTRAFGFKEEMRVGTPSGGMHGEASFKGQLVMMGQGAHERSLKTPKAVGAATMGCLSISTTSTSTTRSPKRRARKLYIRQRTSPTAVPTGRTIPRAIHGSSRARRRRGSRSTAQRLLPLSRVPSRDARHSTPCAGEGNHAFPHPRPSASRSIASPASTPVWAQSSRICGRVRPARRSTRPDWARHDGCDRIRSRRIARTSDSHGPERARQALHDWALRTRGRASTSGLPLCVSTRAISTVSACSPRRGLE
jgi:hypothetical protein